MGKKHWIRKIVLALIGAAIVTGIILSINIEPADYRDTFRGRLPMRRSCSRRLRQAMPPGCTPRRRFCFSAMP